MRSSTRTKRRERADKDPVKIALAQNQEMEALEHAGGQLFSRAWDIWLLKYEVDDIGIGPIILPPSLSMLLQSDRVYIAPFAGGLLIR